VFDLRRIRGTLPAVFLGLSGRIGMVSDPTAVFFVLAAVVTLAVGLEARFRLFRSLGSALVAILIAMLLSNTGLIPGSSSVYNFLAGPAVSAGIALILLSVDVRTIVKAGPTMLAAFGVGAVGRHNRGALTF